MNPVQELFGGSSTPDTVWKFRELKKRGEPWLLLPKEGRLAAAALTLYPAQSGKARLIKRVLSGILKCGFGGLLGLRGASIAVASSDPFAQFLKRMSGHRSGVGSMAILCGNPKTAGRRFVFLLFNDAGEPSVIVKAGHGDAARRLIAAEAGFLRTVRQGVSGVPPLLEEFKNGKVGALAMPYVAGETPTGKAEMLRQKIGAILEGWLESKERRELKEFPQWQAVRRVENAPATRIEAALAGVKMQSTLWHGDFAPWNIKVTADGSWRVLDWERGSLSGPPGWDWFHYEIQTGILVEKLNSEALHTRLESLFVNDTFGRYAKSSGIQGNEKALVLAYLLYCREILKPSEGGREIRALIDRLSASWLKII